MIALALLASATPTADQAAEPLPTAVDASLALPADVRHFIDRRTECEHFLGEEPYDAERRRYLDNAIRELCTGSDASLNALRRTYADEPAILQLLATYEPVGS